MAIASFRSKPLEELFVDGATRRIDKRLHRKLLQILDVMNRAEGLADIAGLPGYRHPLGGDRKGDHAITITRNYRITFRMAGQDVCNVHYEDYH
jgi:proteic killer suppression protein